MKAVICTGLHTAGKRRKKNNSVVLCQSEHSVTQVQDYEEEKKKTMNEAVSARYSVCNNFFYYLPSQRSYKVYRHISSLGFSQHFPLLVLHVEESMSCGFFEKNLR